MRGGFGGGGGRGGFGGSFGGGGFGGGRPMTGGGYRSAGPRMRPMGPPMMGPRMGPPMMGPRPMMPMRPMYRPRPMYGPGLGWGGGWGGYNSGCCLISLFNMLAMLGLGGALVAKLVKRLAK